MNCRSRYRGFVLAYTLDLLNQSDGKLFQPPSFAKKAIFATEDVFFKFLLEAVIAFRNLSDPLSDQILAKLAELLLSDQSRLLLARNPYVANNLLSSYVFFDESGRNHFWSNLLLSLTKAFPPSPSDTPLYRLEEVRFARWKLEGGLLKRPDVRHFFKRTPWLNEEQMYAFTHQFFYLTDYGKSPLKKASIDCLRFIEDCFVLNLRGKNLDLMLEFLICYASCGNNRATLLKLFEKLTYRLFQKTPEMHLAGASTQLPMFVKFYHQYFLMMIYDSLPLKADRPQLQRRTETTEYFELLRRSQFVKSLNTLNIVRTYRLCARLKKNASYDYYKSILKTQALALKVTGVTEVSF